MAAKVKKVNLVPDASSDTIWLPDRDSKIAELAY
jgi:hypothetical protein